MGRSLPTSRFATQRATLHLYDPRSHSPSSDCWKINGHLARLLIWTTDEWERLEQRPADAQFHPFGVWCALRIE